MAVVDELRRILQREYGITSDADLEEAIRNMPGVNIALFVSGDQKAKITTNDELEQSKGAEEE